MSRYLPFYIGDIQAETVCCQVQVTSKKINSALRSVGKILIYFSKLRFAQVVNFAGLGAFGVPVKILA
jgi:hypothetical protein